MKKIRDRLIDIGFYLGIFGILIWIYSTAGDPIPRIQKIQVNGNNISVQNVEILQIPSELYVSIRENPTWSSHFIGHKKRAFLLLDRNEKVCSQTPWGKYVLEAERIFDEQPTIKKNYVRSFEMFSGQEQCKGGWELFCPIKWLYRNCSHSLCIINPNTREIIRDSSRKPEQILPLLMAYTTWDKEPLIKQTDKK